jgi:hypothetical protein
MAAPSGVIDGSLSQFYLGQSTADPGLERTDFGIPANCAGAEPGVYCNQAIGVDQNFQLRDLLGNVIGTMTFNPVNSQWTVYDLTPAYAGYGLCYNLGTSEDPEWVLSVVTNLWTGAPGQFVPYPPFDVPPVILYQSITSTVGPAVGSLVPYP